MTEARGLGRDTLWYLASMLVSGALGFAQLSVFSWLLPKAEYGVYFLHFSLATVFNAFGFAWINQTIKRFLNELSGQERARFLGQVAAMYTLVIAGMLLLGLAALALLPSLGIAGSQAWPALALALGTGAVTCIQWFYSVRRQAADFAINQVVYNLLRLGLGWFWLTAVQRSGQSLAWAMALAGLLAALLGLTRLREPLHLSRESFSRSALLSFARYGWALSLTNGAGWLLNTAGRVILAPLAGPAVVGVYSAVQQLAQQIMILAVQPLVTAVDPLAIRLHAREGAAAAARFLSMCLGCILLLGSGVCLSLALLAQPLADAVLAAEYREGAALLGCFAPAMLCWLITPLLIKPHEFNERLHELPWQMLGAGGLNILLNILLIPYWGAGGAALATLAANVLLVVLNYRLGQGLLRWSLPWRWMLLSAGGLLCMTAVHSMLSAPHGLGVLALTLTSYMLGYLAVCGLALYLLPGVFAQERSFLRQVAGKRIAQSSDA